jgi:hypothetical protein
MKFVGPPGMPVAATPTPQAQKARPFVFNNILASFRDFLYLRAVKPGPKAEPPPHDMLG